jgi:hypothetical protein
MTTQPGSVDDHAGALRRAIAQRVADAHRGIDDASLLSFVSGSTVERLADERSDVDMSVVFAALPAEAVLRQACRRVGGEWFWSQGTVADGGLVVAFRVDGIEVQIGYSTLAQLNANIAQLVVEHNPDTPNHKLAEGVLKALPLAGAAQVAALQARLAPFPPALGRAMVQHGLATPTPWRAITQLLHRDAGLWCREIQVEACYRLLLVLCGLNGRYFTRFQVKRVHRLAAQLSTAPPALAERIEALLAAPPSEAFMLLHALEGEVLELVAAALPDVEQGALHQRRTAFVPD